MSMKVNPFELMTPEKKRAAIAKSVAVRKANKQIRNDAALARRALTVEINQLKNEVSHVKALTMASKALTGEVLLKAGDIVKASLPFKKICGVYFLIKDGLVVYVGQSVDIFTRLGMHENFKSFDSYAFIECDKAQLDLVESLYIHTLNPLLNGDLTNGSKQAPVSLKGILALAVNK